MRTWAVGTIFFHDNKLEVRIINAPDWKTALDSALKAKFSGSKDACVTFSSNILDDCKIEAFNGDWTFDVIEVLD
jgi:hypothetical protein